MTWYDINERRKWYAENHLEARSLPWLELYTIFLAKHGSTAYGTNTPTSDLDIKGVAIAPLKYQIGFLHKFEQADSGFKGDVCIYDLTKFIKLAAECNPNIIELLFLDEGDYIYSNQFFTKIVSEREIFLSTEARWRFGRYAAAQLKRIDTHRKWLLNPPTKEPWRKDFDLPDTTLLPKDQLAAADDLVQKKMESWNFDFGVLDPAPRMELEEEIKRVLREQVYFAKYYSNDDIYNLAAKAIGFDTNMLEVMKRERQYKSARNEWDQYQEWKRKRNPDRSALEAKYGYDTKHGMHLVRLLRMAQEILSEGKVVVRRPDAEELLSIRRGAWSYEKLVEWATVTDASLDELMKKSPLPTRPDREKIDQLLRDTVMDYLGL